MGKLIHLFETEPSSEIHATAQMVYKKCVTYLPEVRDEHDERFRNNFQRNLNLWFHVMDEMDSDFKESIISDTEFKCNCGTTVYGFTLFSAITTAIFFCFDECSIYDVIRLGHLLEMFEKLFPIDGIVNASYCPDCKRVINITEVITSIMNEEGKR